MCLIIVNAESTEVRFDIQTEQNGEVQTLMFKEFLDGGILTESLKLTFDVGNLRKFSFGDVDLVEDIFIRLGINFAI